MNIYPSLNGYHWLVKMTNTLGLYFPFSALYSTPIQLLPNGFEEPFLPPPLDFTEISRPTKLHKAKYHRTWNKPEIEEAYNIVVKYCQNFNKTISQLTLNEFGIISIGLKQTPEQVMIKVKEINTNGTMRPGKWSQPEDDMLRELVQRHQDKWGKIANVLNFEIHGRIPIRNSKNCKERWNNYLNPDINRGAWTENEDIAMLEGYLQHGSKWSMIAETLSNRIESFIKNRVKSLLHKAKKSNHEDKDITQIIRELIVKIKDRRDCRSMNQILLTCNYSTDKRISTAIGNRE